MAYLEFAPIGGAAFPVANRPAPAMRAGDPGFTGLEWTVIDLAQNDRLSSLDGPGPIARAMRWAFGGPAKTMLSDPRLEALRRIAVLSWYRGFAVAPAEVRAFVAAGFTLDHYEMLLDRVAARRAALPRRFQR